MKHFVITAEIDGEKSYWCNRWGWVYGKENATVFTEGETKNGYMPMH